MDGPLLLIEYKADALMIAYVAHAERVPGRRAYRGIRPKHLEIDVNDRRVFEIVWSDEGKRREIRIEPGWWDEALREEIKFIDDDERF